MFALKSSSLKTISHSVLLGLLFTPISALSATTVDMAVKQAVEKNPEVQAVWHNFLSSGQQTRQAAGEYDANLDFFADYSWQYRSDYTNETFNGASARLEFSKMLYDGDRVKNSVAQFKNTELVRYFEMLDKVEDTALEAYTAYQDVLRYRELTSLAQKNYDSHKQVYDKIASGVETGHTRGADLEQINGRLALSKSNLLTEKANLHDVTARYLRIVGSAPGTKMTAADLQTAMLPSSFKGVMEQAYMHNANLHAAIRNIDAKRSAVEYQRSDGYPRLDLTAEYGGQTYDNQGANNSQTDGKVALEFRYNLYDGERSSSAFKGAKEDVSRAVFLREKACNDMRQNLQISYNDVKKLDDQLPILEKHRDASDKVRVAFTDQFSINKRTLLDLLDTEIEFFQSGRAYANAHYDKNISVAKTLSEMGKLLTTLNVSRQGLPDLADLGAEPTTVNAESTCPIVELPELVAVPNLPAAITPNKFKAPAADNTEGNFYRLEIQFTMSSAVIDPKYSNDIAELARFMKDNQETVVEIHGHASLDGPDDYNMKLSQRRAQAVVDALIQQHNIAPDRLKAIGFGETKPLIEGMSWPANKANRRIESNIKNAPR